MAFAVITLLTVELFVCWNFWLFMYATISVKLLGCIQKKKLPVIWEAFAI